MIHGDAFGLFVGAVALGAVHGVEPGHGWPVAASYALDQSNKWLYGVASSFILGVGHLVSSIVMVGAFFYAKSYFSLTQVNEPITVSSVQIGGPVSLVAGVLLVALGLREYRHGHAHEHGDHEHEHDAHGDHEHEHDAHGDHEHEHDAHGDHEHEHDTHGDHEHEHDDHAHTHDGHDHGDGGLYSRLKAAIPVLGGHSHSEDLDEAADRGLLGIAWFAFVLGFAHEEEFEIIALCAGSPYCLELMTAYALTVVAGIVGLTLLLIAGYQRFEARVERYVPYLPTFSAAVLVLMGLGFVTGLF